MEFEAKLRRLGTSLGIIIPAGVLKEMGWEKDNIIMLWTTKDEKKPESIIMLPSKPLEEKIKLGGALASNNGFDTRWCRKHDVMMGSCGCQ